MMHIIGQLYRELWSETIRNRVHVRAIDRMDPGYSSVRIQFKKDKIVEV
jgi:hypothetical protein